MVSVMTFGQRRIVGYDGNKPGYDETNLLCGKLYMITEEIWDHDYVVPKGGVLMFLEELEPGSFSGMIKLEFLWQDQVILVWGGPGIRDWFEGPLVS